MNKKIKTLAAAFKAMGVAPGFVPDVSMWPEHARAGKIAEYNLEMAIMAVSGKDKVNMLDPNQPKYYAWFRNIEKKVGGVSGRGLSLFFVALLCRLRFLGFGCRPPPPYGER